MRMSDKERVARQNIVCCFLVFLTFILLASIKVEVHRVRADSKVLIGSRVIIGVRAWKEQIGLKRLDVVTSMRTGRRIAATSHDGRIVNMRRGTKIFIICLNDDD